MGTARDTETDVLTNKERKIFDHTSVEDAMLNDKAPNNIDLKFYSSSRLGIRISIHKFSHQAQRLYSTEYDDSFGIKAADHGTSYQNMSTATHH